MNRHSRPTQVTGLFVAELRWSALLGGGTETIGPMPAHQLRARLRAICAPYPGDHQPSITMREIPRAAS